MSSVIAVQRGVTIYGRILQNGVGLNAVDPKDAMRQTHEANMRAKGLWRNVANESLGRAGMKVTPSGSGCGGRPDSRTPTIPELNALGRGEPCWMRGRHRRRA